MAKTKNRNVSPLPHRLFVLLDKDGAIHVVRSLADVVDSVGDACYVFGVYTHEASMNLSLKDLDDPSFGGEDDDASS